MGPKRYTPKPVRAMQWQPGDLMQAGLMVGWLQANGVKFEHPSGYGSTTTIRLGSVLEDLEEDSVFPPGSWVVHGPYDDWFCLTDEQFRAAHQDVD